MGGHHSRQSVSETTKTITDATFKSTQNCITISDGGNTFSIMGDNNFVQNVNQTTSLSVDGTCAQKLASSSDFSSRIASEVSQSLKTQEQAMMSWATPGKSTSKANVSNVVQNNITSELVQNCLAQLSGQNVFSIVGSNNVTQNVLQSTTMSKFGGCMGNSAAVAKAATDVTNTVNQKMQDVQKSPFAFITDAIQGAVADVAIVVGIIVFAVVMLVVLAKLLGKKKPQAPPLPDPGALPV